MAYYVPTFNEKKKRWTQTKPIFYGLKINVVNEWDLRLCQFYVFFFLALFMLLDHLSFYSICFTQSNRSFVCLMKNTSFSLVWLTSEVRAHFISTTTTTKSNKIFRPDEICRMFYSSHITFNEGEWSRNWPLN